MRDRIYNTIIVLGILSLMIFYGWIFHNIIGEEEQVDAEINRREYIKFQRDSLELEILKKRSQIKI